MKTKQIADHTTWCGKNVKCGVNLEKILNEIGDERLVKKVNTQIHRFSKKVNVLDGIDNYKEYFLKYVYKDSINTIKDAKYQKVVETHLMNLITVKFRQKLKL